MKKGGHEFERVRRGRWEGWKERKERGNDVITLHPQMNNQKTIPIFFHELFMQEFL